MIMTNETLDFVKQLQNHLEHDVEELYKQRHAAAMLIIALKQREATLEAQLMAVILRYRTDMAREMRSGFDQDAFDEMVQTLVSSVE